MAMTSGSVLLAKAPVGHWTNCAKFYKKAAFRRDSMLNDCALAGATAARLSNRTVKIATATRRGSCDRRITGDHDCVKAPITVPG